MSVHDGTSKSYVGSQKLFLIALLASWTVALAAYMGSSTEWQVLKDYLRQCPPLLLGILPIGLCLQAIVTFLAFTRWKRIAPFGIAFAFGYWTSALVSLVAAYWFVARGTLVASP